MSILDTGILIIIACFGLFGLWFGFVHALGSLLGTILGAYLASRFYAPMAEWLNQTTGWGGNVPKVVLFVIAFVIINRLVGLVFWVIGKILSIVTHLPFIRSLDRFLGMIFGLLEGAITVGLAIYFIERFPLYPALMEKLSTSTFAPIMRGIAEILLPLLPKALTILHSTVEYVEQFVTSTPK